MLKTSLNVKVINILIILIEVYSSYGAVSGNNLLLEPPNGPNRSPEEEKIWCTAEQVHLSFGSSVSEMTVMWSTRGDCSMLVQYAPHPWNLNHAAEGMSVELADAEFNSFKFIHRAELKDLLPSTTYYFRPMTTSNVGAGPLYFLTPAAPNVTNPVNFLISSHLDTTGSMKPIVDEALSGKYAALLYNGELESQLHPTAMEKAEETFLSQLSQVTAYLPMLTAPDKKGPTTEGEDGLYLYRNIFSMPGTDWPTPADKLWYSIDIGSVHLVSYSTEMLFEADNRRAKLQQEWLVKDLMQVNKNREATPWVIALGSHPMYCSYGVADTDDCAQNTSKVKHGLEDIFYHFGVDLVVESRHSFYERTWPQYKGVLLNTSYVQPRAPIQVVIGYNPTPKVRDENTTSAPPTAAEWSAFHLSEPTNMSYARLSVINASHLRWELVSDQSVLDTFWLIQDNHGNFSLASLPHNISHQINQTILALGGKPGTYDFISGSSGDPQEVEGWSQYSLWLGLAVLAAVVFLVLGALMLRSCIRKKRARGGRRWRDVDRDSSGSGNFYSVGSDSDSDDNDFEIDVYDKASKQSSKLLTSY
ncbi:acid phosphatase type 7-like [Physella acuta]|uniref:acid phosphatase type 7-like n=1 Tax=Physella acuta TaxID=109671 RepID=UPI0027DC6AC8|nr:acid phosphatase type 7-like [Physella acuta]XP_059171102.1 acid phosphatase type 7-like [Physella acuta]XP_059171103.1 acid phosphatase type 7-like [Physella acuta]